MPKLVPISHRELARKLRRAGCVEIRTRRHTVYYLAAQDLTIPVPNHPGDVPKGTCGPPLIDVLGFANVCSRLPVRGAHRLWQR